MKKHNVLLGIGLALIVVSVIFPIQPQLMDLLIAATIGFSVISLVVVMLTKTTSRSWLPSVLLVLSMSKLALSVSVIRLILSAGHAGGVVGTFGNFLGAGNLIIGLAILGVVTLVSFAAIITSEKRISEVAASTEFCEAMQGVMKFVKGDAIFVAIALVIIMIGGTAMRDENIGVFMLLAIGYGVAFFIPAVLIAFASVLGGMK
ncbi:MAG: flagellar biosynthesis protein FlhA [Defluviitaleaceae bacterium]|nr:flagellar biosynthesis protein FlhA [Defluviitaleaceae bacterium]MCL2263826.1 flagellar biosynthesis protein FlhA [Defluviitaleaceae bacterium]